MVRGEKGRKEVDIKGREKRGMDKGRRGERLQSDGREGGFADRNGGMYGKC